jgi:hypothetical protein
VFGDRVLPFSLLSPVQVAAGEDVYNASVQEHSLDQHAHKTHEIQFAGVHLGREGVLDRGYASKSLYI